MCFALIRIEYGKDETIKPIDLLVCTHQPKRCLVILGFGGYCTVTTTPCWNDARANIFHQPPCEMNSVDPVCCPTIVLIRHVLSAACNLLGNNKPEHTAGWPICEVDECLRKHMAIQVKPDPGSSLEFLCSDPKRIVCHWVLQIPSPNWVTAIGINCCI